MLNNQGRPLGKIFIISGSSGSGKTTLLKKARQKREFKDNLIKITTVTTRAPRSGEKNGQDYQFVDKAEFWRRKKKGEFIESQEIYGDYYATPKKNLEEVIASGKDALLCVDVKGGRTLKRLFPKNAALIFIMTPNFESLKKRLVQRSSESSESLRKRLNIAQEEIKYAKWYDYTIVNDVVRTAVAQLSAIIQAERLKVCSRGRPCACPREE